MNKLEILSSKIHFIELPKMLEADSEITDIFTVKKYDGGDDFLDKISDKDFKVMGYASKDEFREAVEKYANIKLARGGN